jgi:transcriptional regulator with AAA-type ATPase domain
MVNYLNQHNEVLQPMSFSNVVEVIKILSTDENLEIQLLLQQYLREERRDEIYDNFKLAQVEQQKGELKFSSNIKELRQLIEE